MSVAVNESGRVPPCYYSASEVTTLRHYTNMFIIIILPQVV